MRYKDLIAIALFFLVSINLVSQTSKDFYRFSPELDRSIIEPADTKDNNSLIRDRNEIQNLGFMLYSIYRNLISSQDGTNCKFYPTCSAYCRSAVRKNGLILGMIQGVDRITRCNGLSPNKYTIDIERRRLIDYVY